MSRQVSIAELLRWRLARAEAEPPPAPNAAHLLELARPPWERWPARFEALLGRLSAMRLAYGYAQAGTVPRPRGHAVPTVIDDAHGTETFARVLYLVVRDGTLRLRFQLEAGADMPAYDATFVDEATSWPLLHARASVSLEQEYRLDADLPDALSDAWASLTVTDPMPFRLILRPVDAPT